MYLPVFSAIGVVLELTLASTPRSNQVLPSRSIERIEIIFKNQFRDRFADENANAQQQHNR